MRQEGQKLVAGAADLGLQRSREVAGTRGREDVGQAPLQRPALGGQRRGRQRADPLGKGEDGLKPQLQAPGHRILARLDSVGDRKSTRLNSSHANISYAVFCLKKKNEATLSV